MTSRARAGAILPLLLLALLAAGCGGGPSDKVTLTKLPKSRPQPHGGATIQIFEFGFSPRVAVIKAGSVARWHNSGGLVHTIRPYRLPSVSGTSVTGSRFLTGLGGETYVAGAYSYRFNRPGTYRYLCKIHPKMKGVIKVIPD